MYYTMNTEHVKSFRESNVLCSLCENFLFIKHGQCFINRKFSHNEHTDPLSTKRITLQVHFWLRIIEVSFHSEKLKSFPPSSV